MAIKNNIKKQPIYINNNVPEYKGAFLSFIFFAIKNLTAAKDPVLSQLRFSETERSGGNIVGGDSDLIVNPIRVETKFQLQLDEIKNTDIEGFLLELDKGCSESLGTLMPQFFSRLSEITALNTIDAEGKTISHDLIIDAIECMQLSFDENDNPVLPILIMHPSLSGKLLELPYTNQHADRLNKILVEKKDEHIAKKRVRKLC